MNKTHGWCWAGLIAAAVLVGCEDPVADPGDNPTDGPGVPTGDALVNEPGDGDVGIAEAGDGDAAVAVPSTLPTLTAEGLEALLAEASAAGEVVVLDFWGTWCAPCVALFPGLHEELVAIEGVRPVTAAWDYDDPSDEIVFLMRHHALDDAYIVPLDDGYEALHNRASARIREGGNIAYPIVIVFGPDGEIAAEFHQGEGEIDAAEVGAAAREALGG